MQWERRGWQQGGGVLALSLTSQSWPQGLGGWRGGEGIGVEGNNSSKHGKAGRGDVAPARKKLRKEATKRIRMEQVLKV